MLEMFKDLPTTCVVDFAKYNEDGSSVVILGFTEQGFGFGQITILTDKDGNTEIDSETMSRDHVKRLLGVLVDKATKCE